MNRHVDVLVSDLRRLAVERCGDWEIASSNEPATGRENFVTKEQWRWWREGRLLTEIDSQPLEGNRILLNMLIRDLHGSYRARCAGIKLLESNADASPVQQLRSLTSAAHAQISKLVAARPKPGNAENTSQSLNRLAAVICSIGKEALESAESPRCSDGQEQNQDVLALKAFVQRHAKSSEQLWAESYSSALSRLEADVVNKCQFFRGEMQQSAVAIQRAFRGGQQRRATQIMLRQTRAVVRLQHFYRHRFRPRMLKLRNKLRVARESCLLWRLRRALARYMRKRRFARSSMEFPTFGEEIVLVVLRIQAFLRGRWCRRGWTFCWAPPFHRPSTYAARMAAEELPPLTLQMRYMFAAHRRRRDMRKATEKQRESWLQTLEAERFLVDSYCRWEDAKGQREAQLEHRRKRFSAQWDKYAEGLADYIRSSSMKEDHWVATVDSEGKPIWMSRKSGKTRKNNPLDNRMEKAMSQEKKKAEDRFKENEERLLEYWEEQNAAEEASLQEGEEELVAAWCGRPGDLE